MAFTKTASDRGIFDANLPLQGIFDNNIFDTELAVAIDTIILPAFVHDDSTITVLTHGNVGITLR